MKAIEVIRKWVSERSSFYFFLPDGPYGRPFDNQYIVESIDLTDKDMIIKFNDGLVLHFIGQPEVVDEGCNLLINEYKICRFEEYNHLLKSFDYGEVVLNGF